MTLSGNDTNGWTGAAAGPVTNTVASLAAGASTTLDIVLNIDDTFAGSSIVNVAEISSSDNAGGLPDVDSVPDGTEGNDAGGAVDTPSDDVVDGDGTGVPGDEEPTTDEDDSDPASVPVDQPLSIGSTVFADIDDLSLIHI